MRDKGDAIVVYKLDRLGRKTKGLIDLAETLEKQGVDLISITENIDTSTPSGKLLFSILAAVGQMEADLISERTKAGLAAARARGHNGGRPKKDKKTIDKALKMYESKQFTLREITETTGVSKSCVYHYLRERDAASN